MAAPPGTFPEGLVPPAAPPAALPGAPSPGVAPFSACHIRRRASPRLDRPLPFLASNPRPHGRPFNTRANAMRGVVCMLRAAAWPANPVLCGSHNRPWRPLTGSTSGSRSSSAATAAGDAASSGLGSSRWPAAGRLPHGDGLPWLRCWAPHGISTPRRPRIRVPSHGSLLPSGGVPRRAGVSAVRWRRRSAGGVPSSLRAGAPGAGEDGAAAAAWGHEGVRGERGGEEDVAVRGQDPGWSGGRDCQGAPRWLRVSLLMLSPPPRFCSSDHRTARACLSALLPSASRPCSVSCIPVGMGGRATLTGRVKLTGRVGVVTGR